VSAPVTEKKGGSVTLAAKRFVVPTYPTKSTCQTDHARLQWCEECHRLLREFQRAGDPRHLRALNTHVAAMLDRLGNVPKGAPQ
jgi:hypothetical protein